MKQLLILSGKGGTGKTTVAAAFIALEGARAFADCDVDAPNLHLVMQNLPPCEKFDYYGFGKAKIDPEKCINCGLCEKNCAFDAISNFTVGVFECEGCGVCAEICPVGAVTMQEVVSGDLMLYKDAQRVFSTARLQMGSGASGKLVSAVKKQLTEHSPSDVSLAVIDGSPGIGCPVIASISGVDFVLIVAEPSVSGIHDMLRILSTAKHFGVPCGVCINKFDTAPDKTQNIEDTCREMGIEVFGRIPYDETVVHALNRCENIACYPESAAGRAIAEVYQCVKSNLVPRTNTD